MQRWRQWCAAIVLWLGAGQALAHPHIWIDSYYQVNVSSPKIRTLEAYWQFDVFSSVDMLMEFDKNADGQLLGAEKVDAAQAMNNLAQYGYFLKIQVAGRELTPARVDVLDVGVVDQAMTVRLGITLDESVNLQQNTLRLGFGDVENYFAMVIPDAGLIKLTGMLAETCTPTEADAEEIYMEGWVDLSCDA
ncbi:DUF1007 family protein [Marinomonas fungiae]|uniref:ABC-type uncharacterized transport system, periplasmic component n=1 Tax=Marinomonas fungiae TaxID=1137284 RepID=A0A0K6IN91_9GAMM|nr:DUF1007 family protein [Marinomonas fungiae]CUB04561.1 ABC-type uncharacterized transport system, periplasmic component [Marinomonas fungiae]